MTTQNIQKKSGELVKLSDAQLALAGELDALAASGLACQGMREGFEKALITSVCIKRLRGALTGEVMEPIMALQDSPLGFRTDREKEGGYGEDVVRDALINAVMVGLMPCGNHFNILAKRMYVTKEGFTYLLDRAGVRYTIDQGVPVMKSGGCIVATDVRWETADGEKGSKHLEIPVRVNNGMGADAILGKADRKAKCWLFNNLTHSTLADGDVEGDGGVMRDVTPGKGGLKVAKLATKVVTDGHEQVEQDGAQVAENKEEVSEKRATKGGDKSPDGRWTRDEDMDDSELLLEASLEEGEKALAWMEKSLRGSGATWGKVYKVCEAVGVRHPEIGCGRGELAGFALAVRLDGDLRGALEQSGIIFEK